MSETPKYAGCAKCGGAAACWCGQPRLDTPAPDHAQAQRYAKVVSSDAHFEEPLKVNLARAYLALSNQSMGGLPCECVDVGECEKSGKCHLAASPQEGREADDKDAVATEYEPTDEEKVASPLWYAGFRKGYAAAEQDALRATLPVAPLPPVVTEDYKALYLDLLYQVAKVTPGETRHESAKRIIRVHEEHCGQGGPGAALAERPRG